MKHIELSPQISIVISHKIDGNFRGVESVSPWLQQVGVSTPKMTHLQLEHGDQVAVINAESALLLAADSAVLSGGAGGISLVVGDCIPVVMVDPETHLLALVHGGWRSLRSGIIQKTITTLCDNGAKASRIQVWIGPGIRPCCYRSDTEPLQANEQDWCSFVTKIDQDEQEKIDSEMRWQIDLPGYISSISQKLGISKKQIIDEGVCTCCHPQDFYSHVRSKQTEEVDGRFFVATFWK